MPLDEPIQTRLSWTTSFDQALLARAAEITGRSRPSVASPDEFEAEIVDLGPALPVEGESRISVLTLFHEAGQERLHWLLQLGPAPPEPPPQEILDANVRFGGFNGLKALILDGLQSGPTNAALRATAEFPASSWTCPLLSGSLLDFEAPIRTLDSAAMREQIGYRFEEGPSGLREVSVILDHINKCYIMSVVAQLAWRPPVTGWLIEDRLLMDLMAGTLFTPSGGP